MRIYEELFILKPDVPEEEIETFVEALRTHLVSAGATVDKIEKWGKRRLAYRVEKFREGSYVLIQFTGAPDTVKELERRLRVADNVLKFITAHDETLKRLVQKERDKRTARRQRRLRRGAGATVVGSTVVRTPALPGCRRRAAMAEFKGRPGSAGRARRAAIRRSPRKSSTSGAESAGSA
jgi:small subunit ribosomal protein S6